VAFGLCHALSINSIITHDGKASGGQGLEGISVTGKAKATIIAMYNPLWPAI